jgi:hypothetical protein
MRPPGNKTFIHRVDYIGECNMKRQVLFLGLVLVFSLTCAGSLFAVQKLSSTATIIKIEGNKITVRNDKGEISTVMEDPTGIRVGQTVTLHNGKILKGTAKPGELNPGTPVGINPQPEPPGKNL